MRKSWLVLVVLLGLGLAGCNQQVISGPGFGYSSQTPATTGITNSGIKISGSAGTDLQGGNCSEFMAAHVWLNGSSVQTTNASVTFFTPLSTYAATWDSLDQQYLFSGFIDYEAGQVYTLQVTTSLGVASASCTMPGPISLSSNGLSVNWPLPTNMGFAQVSLNGYVVFGDTEIWPPYSFPATMFNNGSGNYQYDISTSWDAYSFVNAAPGSSFSINLQLFATVTK